MEDKDFIMYELPMLEELDISSSIASGASEPKEDKQDPDDDEGDI